MKRNILWIIIVVVIIAIMWYLCDSQKKKLEQERDQALMEKNAAIELAVAEALENARSKGVTKEPPVRTKIVYVDREAPKKKGTAKKTANSFTDKRDGQVYNYIEVEDQLWMTRNLNFESSDSWCYEGDAKNCENWGRMYTWDAAVKACPEGWRLPTNEDWDKLIWRFGGNEVAGRHLKAGGESEFEVLMAGYRDKKGFFGKADTSAYFWSATELEDTRYANFKGFYKEYSNIGPYTYTKPDGFSIRCVKDK